MTREEAIDKLRRLCSPEQMNALKVLVPELAESEDERIRKWLVELVKNTDTNHSNIKLSENCKLALAWLEKLKEQSREDIINETVKDKAFTTKLLKSAGIVDETGELAEMYRSGQKPTEYLDKDKVYAIMNKLHSLSFSQLIPINSDEFKKIGEITSDVRSLLDYPIEQKEQKPVTHKYNVGATIYYNSFGKIKSMVVANVIDTGDGNPMYEDADGNDVFEKNLILQMHTEKQKSAEWSEDDEGELQVAAHRLASHGYPEDADWLKSLPERFNLQPKQKWSEDDEKNLHHCLEIVGGWEVDYDNANPHYSTWLKSLRPQPHWKPSEEQMKILRKYVMGEWRDLTIGQDKILTSLYNDLESL